MKKYYWQVFLLLVLPFAVQSQAPDTLIAGQLDDYLQRAADLKLFSGSVIIGKQGKILLNNGYGFSDVASGTRNNVHTIYRIGSVTKTFTAAVTLKLCEQGRLSLNDPLQKFFPDYPHGNRIRIWHLLSHSSGIREFMDADAYYTSINPIEPVTHEEMIGLFKNEPLVFKPGTEWGYSNSGYYLLGCIIEQVTGRKYEQAVRDLILDPAGMANSGFNFSALPDSVRARGYQLVSDTLSWVANQPDPTVPYAAGALYSTSEDLYKWGEAWREQAILKKETWEAAWKKHPDGICSQPDQYGI